MATALTAQLALIAARSTNPLDLKAQKKAHSQSLLFERSIAAAQDFDTIYQICIEGFQELCQIDARFSTFARSIFNEQSKQEDRATMTVQQNEELNEVLEKFLGLLGGRLFLKPALKAAEWLVRRFRSIKIQALSLAQLNVVIGYMSITQSAWSSLFCRIILHRFSQRYSQFCRATSLPLLNSSIRTLSP